MKAKTPPFGLRMPAEIKAWIEGKARQSHSSQNNEIIRILAKARADDVAVQAASRATTGQTA